jgi:transcriptional regulator with GAF, ATPase, and Fis domain
MGEDVDGTLSHIDESAPSLPAAPQLFLALECDRPLAPPLRLALDGVDEVLLGRGAEREVRREVEDGVRRLHIRLPDGWLSSRHARLSGKKQVFTLEDLGSKNGTLLKGSPLSGRMILDDGDLFETGHAIFLFRQAATRPLASPPDEDATQIAAALPELATFVPALAEHLDGLARVAGRADVPVMLLGESGTGKEVMARALHQLSRRTGEFVAVNCGSLPQSLLEAELFGYRKGAFSGASEDRAGLVRAADRGTLFLDEIGDLSLTSQVALLRVLQEREVLPLGGTRPVKVDLRVVTATHRDLPDLVSQGTFRADLFGRLSGYRLTLPRLRDRREDLGLLIGRLLGRSAPEPSRVRFTPRAARALFRYPWPLNIRELEKCLTTAVALAGDAPVDLPHLPEELRRAAVRPPTPPAKVPDLTEEDRRRREEIMSLLTEHRGNVTRVANAMGKAPMQIHRWLKRYAIDLRTFRGKA